MNEIVIPASTGDVGAWDPNSGAPLPAHIANALGTLGTNIADRMTVPSLSYEGKMWTIVKDGNKTKLQTTNSDGDTVPVPIMRLVVLDYNSERGRAYYPGVYNPATAAAPACWSPDGKTPDASVKEKQSASCVGCPQSVKGSKIQDGKEMVACGSHRMIAIAPAFDLLSDPLRLKIAVTSDYDKEVVEHGWYAFRQDADFLKSRGITHTALVVTKVKFDPNTAYPKLLFSLDRLLATAEVADIQKALENPKVAELLAEKWTAAGSAGTPKDESDIKPHGLEGAYADGWIAHPDAAGYSYKGQDVVTNEELAARYPAPVEASAPAVPAAEVPASQQIVDVPATPEIVPSEPPAGTPMTALELATNDGWTAHPDTAGYYYKGQEVLATAELEAKYAGNAPVSVAAPAAPDTAAPAAATTVPTSTSPSEVPADVQELLNKWTT